MYYKLHSNCYTSNTPTCDPYCSLYFLFFQAQMASKSFHFILGRVKKYSVPQTKKNKHNYLIQNKNIWLKESVKLEKNCTDQNWSFVKKFQNLFVLGKKYKINVKKKIYFILWFLFLCLFKVLLQSFKDAHWSH